MVAPDIVDSTKSPPAKSPPAKFSSAESSPPKTFSAMDHIAITSKTTLDHAPATLLFQALESVCNGLFLDRHFDSIQESVEIAMKELTPQDQSKFMHSVYELFIDIHQVSNAQVAWLSKFQESQCRVERARLQEIL
ncbi:hypothetical protein K440DRAFT_636870 [Wilcoxina mikolae CBS 423.85]|nr:hypothetical protein K440DRAFT_636870 [Wilcoxina mikolae CBS 423.85]